MFLSWSLAEAWAWFVSLPYVGGVAILILGYIAIALFAAVVGTLSKKRTI